MSVKLVPLLAAIALLLAACGGRSAQPKDDPGAFAVNVVQLIVGNSYTRAWQDLNAKDKAVAPLDEYVSCERRSPVLAAPTSMKVVGVSDESVGLGDGTFVPSTAVKVRMVFPGAGNVLTHTVHLVAEHGHWKWMFPSWRFRDYKADRCPVDAGSTAPPASA